MDIVKYFNENTVSGDNIFNISIDYLMDILKRLKYSHIKNVNMVNGVFIYTYDRLNEEENDIFHTFIVSLDDGSFYNKRYHIDVNDLYNTLKTNIDNIETIRKSRKIKPKAVNKLYYLNNDILTVEYYHENELLGSYSYKFDVIYNIHGFNEEYSKISRLITGNSNTINISYEDIMDKLSELKGRILYIPVIVNNIKVDIPFSKSYLFSCKPEHLLLTVNEVDISNYNKILNENKIGEVYGYTITIIKNRIIEYHFSYIINNTGLI